MAYSHKTGGAIQKFCVCLAVADNSRHRLALPVKILYGFNYNRLQVDVKARNKTQL